MAKENKIGEGFGDLVEVMARLRGKQGCPWDKEQTHISLKPFLLEETYELLDTIESGNSKELAEELGDVLHQIVFHCQIATEKGQFTAEEVVGNLVAKMKRRHPHVFSDRRLSDPEAVLQEWARVKAEENRTQKSASALGNLPRAMPALARAQTLTERASLLGFDWPDIDQVLDKLDEEFFELKTAISSSDKDRISEEIGDVLFSLVNLCRFINLNAEDALTSCIDRFLGRFSHIEKRIRERGGTLRDASLEEMDSLWEEAKKIERQEKR
ncbi:MAG: nucleoside triphosphate pyrophosphohydrolase [Candidatus Binatia bacterium]